jgi:predicted MFS family arabinose efflux permease
MIFNTSRILGPALGAWLLTQGTSALAYGCAAALMLAALPVLYVTPVQARIDAQQAKLSFKQQLQEGLRYTAGHRAIRLVFGFTLINALLGRTVIELLPALSGVLLNGDSATLATLTAAAGIGSIIGGLFVSRQGGGEARLLGLLALSLLLAALLVAMLSWTAGLRHIVVVIGLLSLTATVAGTSSQALAQLLVDDGFRGRVLSIWTMVAMGAPAAGALTMGVLADRLSFPVVLLGFAIVAMLATVLLFRIGRRERDRMKLAV